LIINIIKEVTMLFKRDAVSLDQTKSYLDSRLGKGNYQLLQTSINGDMVLAQTATGSVITVNHADVRNYVSDKQHTEAMFNAPSDISEADNEAYIRAKQVHEQQLSTDKGQYLSDQGVWVDA